MGSGIVVLGFVTYSCSKRDRTGHELVNTSGKKEISIRIRVSIYLTREDKVPLLHVIADFFLLRIDSCVHLGKELFSPSYSRVYLVQKVYLNAYDPNKEYVQSRQPGGGGGVPPSDRLMGCVAG